MRALCEQFYCPTCRTDLPEVFFMKNPEKFSEMPVRKFITNKKLRIQFEDEEVRNRFEQLLEHKCKLCPDRYPEKSFKALRDHMRRVHTMFFCDLCLELKIFTSERKVYNRQDHATHRRLGDKDDTSYKGHPLCQFCEERYLDKDELFKHLRKDHFFCHFCESLGTQEFYADYGNLRGHFLTEHYLCEEGECENARFTNVFRSDIDLKSHQAQHHSKAQTKQQARQERTINIDINLVPRPNSRSSRGGRERYDEGRQKGAARNQGGRGGRGGRYTGPSYSEREDIDRAIQASLSTMRDEDMKKDRYKSKQESSSSEDEFIQTEDNFPALGANNYQVNTNVAASTAAVNNVAESKPSLADKFAMSNSMTVQHGKSGDFPMLKPSGSRVDSPTNMQTLKTSAANYAAAYSAKTVEDDFPELTSASKSQPVFKGTWNTSKISETNKTSNNSQKHKKTVVPASNSYNVNDFPSLGPPQSVQKPQWFQVNEQSKKQNRPMKGADRNESVENIINRFSPVNVPDSPKAEKNKSKKKKKKDKVSEIKQEVNGTGLKANASLDDIAEMFMSSCNAKPTSEPESKPKEMTAKPASKKKEDKIEKKIKNEQKELKIEKKMENEKKGLKAEKKVENEKKEIKIEKKMQNEKKGSKAEKKIENEKKELKTEKNMESEKKELKMEEAKPVTLDEELNSDVTEPVDLLEKFSIAEDFPALGTASPPKKPPPGFRQETKQVCAKAPPGFNPTSNHKLPPGFTPNIIGEEQRTPYVSQDPILQLPSTLRNFTYLQPEDFQNRNSLLIGSIQSLCTEDAKQFADFKVVSGEFRRSEIDATKYYWKCQDILGKNNFEEIFPELMALLPDIEKQQDLLMVYMQNLNRDDNQQKGSEKGAKGKGAWTKTQSGFLTCSTCGQVLVRRDYNSHISSHNLDSDFPSLAGAQTTFSGSRSWVKSS